MQVPRAGALRTSSNRRRETVSPLGRGVFAEDAVDLRTHQQLDVRGVLALLDEQVEEVGLAVHGAHHTGLGQALGRLRAVAQPLDPAKRLALLARLRGLGRLAGLIALRRRGRVEPGPQHPQRDPVGIDRKGRVQVQAAGERAGLVRANHPQPLCLAAPGEAQAGGVLDTQHRVLGAHALQRAPAMGRKDVLDTDLAVGGLVDEPVMSLDQGTRSVGGAGDGAHRGLCHMVRSLDQARAQACIAQRSSCELVRRPGVGVEPLAGASGARPGAGSARRSRHAGSSSYT